MAVYKYMTAEGAVRFLNSWHLRITPPADFNDPFELRPPANSVVTQHYLDEQIRSEAPSEAIKELSERLFTQCQVRLTITEATDWARCMIKPPDAREQKRILKKVRRKVPGLSQARLLALQGQAQKQWPILMQSAEKTVADLLPQVNALMQHGFTERLPSMLGVLCLSRNGNDALMWAHYADSHKGVVIEFDDSHPAFNRRRSLEDEFGWLRPVAYSKDRPELNMRAVDDDTVFQVFALTKAEQWRYEDELRLIWPLQLADQTVQTQAGPIALISCPPSAVKSVTFGCKVMDSTIETVRNALSRHVESAHVNLRQACLHETAFELIYSPLHA